MQNLIFPVLFPAELTQAKSNSRYRPSATHVAGDTSRKVSCASPFHWGLHPRDFDMPNGYHK